METMREVEAKSAKAKIQKTKKNAPDDNGLSYNDRKKFEKELRSETRNLEAIEQAVEELEEAIRDWDVQLADPIACKELMADQDFYPKYEQKKAALSAKMEEWEACNIKKEALEEQLGSS